ncbi:DMT family transporter [Nonomuraea typhae]|uniref:DMT family transporter n=1 Tax=Nonomuraea typhae TaxID=2603600 RepID=UPI0012F8832F|nr:EamA family transporter [Nonomuraea typhae]
MHPISARRGAVYASIAAAAWGTGGAAGSLLFASLDPVAVSFWRHLLGAAFLLPFLLRRPLIRARGWAGHVLIVGAGMAVYQAAYFTAIAESGIALATVVTMGATPVFTALGGRLLLGERLGRAGAGAMAAAITGLVLLTGLSHAGTGAGVTWSLLSGLGYAGVTLYSRRHHGDPEATAVGGFAVAALCLLPFALAGGILPEFTLLSAGALLFLGAVPTALAYGLFFRSLTALKATTVSVISLGEAAGAALLGVVLFGERLTPLAWSGGLLLLGAVVVLTVHGQR